MTDLLRAPIGSVDAPGPWTAELADEADPDSAVILRDGSGAIRYMMSQEAFRKFRKGK